MLSATLLLCAALAAAPADSTALTQRPDSLAVASARAVPPPADSVLRADPLCLDPGRAGELRIGLESLSFVRDNEYKSPLMKGYTLPGIWLRPMLTWQPLALLRLEAGAHLLRYWGANVYPNINYTDIATWKGGQAQHGFHCVPWFRAHLQAAPGLHILLGSLQGGSSHGVVEPLWNDELDLTADPEAGLQVVWEARRGRLDAWVDWESFIFRSDDHQESFTFGLSARLGPWGGRRGAPRWYVPLQALFRHRGGEINTADTERSVKTWLNAAAGLAVEGELRGTRLPVRLSAEAAVCYFGQQSGTMLPFDRGEGLWVKAGAQLWRCTLEAAWWQCRDFVSVMGSPLFGSMSVSESGLTLRRPRTALLRASYAHRLAPGIGWGVRAEAWGHLPVTSVAADGARARTTGKVSVAAGVYLRVSPSFLLRRLK